MPRYFLVETEFLFGLREGDKWNSTVERILDAYDSAKGAGLFTVKCSTVALFEAGAVLMSKGKNSNDIEDALTLMKYRLTRHGIEDEPLTQEDTIAAFHIMDEYQTGFFDAFQASAALRTGASLISNDKTFDKIAAVNRTGFIDFLKTLRHKT